MLNIEYINQARQILTKNYNERHTAEYNAWLGGHTNAWAQPHTIVPFPPFVICAAISPFKSSSVAPSESDIVAKALELYNQKNPVSDDVSIVEDSSSIQEELPIVEEMIAPQEEQQVEILASDTPIETEEIPVEESIATVPVEAAYSKEIYKIFQPAVEPAVDSTTEIKPDATLFDTVEATLNALPQPAKVLSDVATAKTSRPSVLGRLQNITGKWSTGKHDV